MDSVNITHYKSNTITVILFAVTHNTLLIKIDNIIPNTISVMHVTTMHFVPKLSGD